MRDDLLRAEGLQFHSEYAGIGNTALYLGSGLGNKKVVLFLVGFIQVCMIHRIKRKGKYVLPSTCRLKMNDLSAVGTVLSALFIGNSKSEKSEYIG